MTLGTKAKIDRHNEEAHRQWLKEYEQAKADRLQKQEDKKKGRRKYFFFGKLGGPST